MTAQARKLVACISLAVVLIGCAPAPSSPTVPDYWPTGGWISKPPEELGMDSGFLADMVDRIRTSGLNVHSLLIVRHGYLVTELYAYPYTPQQVHQVMSVTKSVMDAVVGIAIAQSSIKDVKQPVFDLLPRQSVANLDERKKAITLENILTQTTGLDCHEVPQPGEPYMQASDNWVDFVANLPMAAVPGLTFNYCTDAAQLLSAVLQDTTGMSAREFANKNLFAPLGIGPLDEDRWSSDPQGVTIGGYGLALTPREMAKLGYLFLNHGTWEGRSVVPADWVTASTSSHSNQGADKEYGYMWWIDPQGHWYAALGRSGQHIFVYPAEDLVVVFTADLPYTNNQDLAPLQGLLNSFILPAVQSDQALAANPGAESRLAASIDAMGAPEAAAPQPIPAPALAISGKAFILDDNPYGWQSITFTFNEGGDEASFELNGVGGRVGMDGRFRFSQGGGPTFPEAFRGNWDDSGALVVEDVVLGMMWRLTYEIRFQGAELTMIRRDVDTGGNTEIYGRLDSASR